MTLPYTVPKSEQEWAFDELAFLGSPATGPDDPRVQYLEGIEVEEGTFYEGNENNPLDIEYSPSYYSPLPGQGVWNSAGVSTFPNVTEGLQASENFMSNPTDEPFLNALRNPHSSLADLTVAMAEGNWEGGGGGSAANVAYARTAAQESGAPQSAQLDAIRIHIPGTNLNLHVGNPISGLTSFFSPSSWERLLFEGVFVLGGLAIVGVGIVVLAEPKAKEAAQTAAKAGVAA